MDIKHHWFSANASFYQNIFDLFKKRVIVKQILRIVQVDNSTVTYGFQIFSNKEVLVVQGSLFHIAEFNDLGVSICHNLGYFRLANLLCLDFETAGVNMGQNVPHLLEVAVCNHAVSFIKD